MKKCLLFVSLLTFFFSCNSDDYYDIEVNNDSESVTNEVRSTFISNYVLNRYPGQPSCDYNIGFGYNPSYDLDIVFAPALPYDVTFKVKVFMKERNFYNEIRSPWRTVTLKAGTTSHVFDVSCQGLDAFINCTGSSGMSYVNFKLEVCDFKYTNSSETFNYVPFNNENYVIFEQSVICASDGWFPGKN